MWVAVFESIQRQIGWMAELIAILGAFIIRASLQAVELRLFCNKRGYLLKVFWLLGIDLTILSWQAPDLDKVLSEGALWLRMH